MATPKSFHLRHQDDILNIFQALRYELEEAVIIVKEANVCLNKGMTSVLIYEFDFFRELRTYFEKVEISRTNINSYRRCTIVL